VVIRRRRRCRSCIGRGRSERSRKVEPARVRPKARAREGSCERGRADHLEPGAPPVRCGSSGNRWFASGGWSSRTGGWRPARLWSQSHGNTELPQRLTCPVRAGNTARIGEETRRGRSAHCAPRVDDTAEALFVTRRCSSSKGTGLVKGQHVRGTRTGSPVRANANERRLAERGR
jgi:hypothetical protein